MDNTKQHILAIDSSTSVLRVGLTLLNGKIAELHSNDRFRHAEFIFKLIEQLLNDNNVDRNDLGAIIVSTGPGSFTGLRVGMASAKGIAVSLNIPIISLSIFVATAERIFNEYGKAGLLVPSRRDEFYLGLIESDKFNDDSISVVSTEKLVAESNGLKLLGVDFENIKFDESLLSNFSRFDSKIDDFIVGGQRKLELSGGDDIARLEPLYIQNFPAKKKK